MYTTRDHPLLVLNRPTCEPDRAPLLGVRKNRFRGSPPQKEMPYDETTSIFHEESLLLPNQNIRAYFSRFWIIGITSITMFFNVSIK